MLSYRHAFHAGNHADILKHSVLLNILEYLNQKEKPYTIFDTHAGSGKYFLSDERALKTREAESGITSFLNESENKTLPESLLNYQKITKLYAQSNLYPGSVEFERIFANDSCAHFVSELNNSEIDVLKKNTRDFPLIMLNHNQKPVKTQVSHRDGLEMILALAPPAIKRGLCVIDPSYEEKNEYNQITVTVIKLHKKWNAGIIFVWYPLIMHRLDEINQMKQTILLEIKKQNQNTSLISAELLVNRQDSHVETDLNNISGPPRLYGSGVFIINPPWKLEEKTKDNLSYIASCIYKESCPSFEVKIY